jgi:transcriptional regulator with XRE-family HTH domain
MHGMEQAPGTLLRKVRRDAGLSQRQLALRANTSQPAIARYERGTATPSWETLQRLTAACGRQLSVGAAAVPEPHDVELAELLLGFTPEQRLRALRRYAQLHQIGQEQR